MKFCFYVLLFFVYWQSASAQSCTAPGQNPGTAFPVCGTSTFSQQTVPLCGGRKLPFRGCTSESLLTDINPYWYKFTCYQSGTLGFLITPHDLGDDYDWELYDITGKDPMAVFTDGNLVVSNNWSGESGLTGASNQGTQTFVCFGRGQPLFSRMPTLEVGHNYLLLISHFTNTQSGYELSFGGGTAVITDPTEPHLKAVEANCGGDELRVSLNKKIRCNSIAGNGSDFVLSAAGLTITQATGYNCSGQFDTDSILLRLSGELAPGTYTLQVKKGTDNNTLLDNCDRPVPETDLLRITILPKAPTPMDSLAPVSCAPQRLRLVFRKPMACTSIAPDGSDFRITGTYPVQVTSATGTCSNGLTKEIFVTLAQPLQQAGTFTIVLQRGTDGNTLFDECSAETPAGAALPFSVKDTVNADFTYTIGYGCERDTVQYVHGGGNGINSWQWALDERQSSGLQNPVALYRVFNTKTVQLVVTNGFCSDTAQHQVVLENNLTAAFDVWEDNCPQELIPFTGRATGRIVNHSWDFGDGGTGTGEKPSHAYAIPFRETTFPVRYTVTDEWGCQRTAEKNIIIYTSCYLTLPTAFTPNGDGLNDYFYPLNAVKAEGLEFTVFNRWGQAVYRTANWKQGWNGTWGGKPQPAGVYVWMLRYTMRDTGQKIERKGTVMLVR